MRRAVRYAVLLAVLGAVLGGWLYHQHARVISDYPLKTLSIEAERLSQQHVGELVAGRSITQTGSLLRPLWRSALLCGPVFCQLL
jgi:hypothetical protein